jgi:TolB-like protein/DNA-binding winged helix-turn-helix (wHTH) protein
MDGDLRVGTWLVQPSLNTISQNGSCRQLEPKVMGVLLCLACHVGETVSKEQLIKAVWPNTFVSDDVLVRCISGIRRAFEDDVREPKFIQTIPKRGYRLVALVEKVNGVMRPTADALQILDAPNETPVSRHGLLIGIAIGIIAAVFFLVLLALAPTSLWRSLVRKNDIPQIRSIAVLPLSSLSGDPTQAYFADGVTDALITDLAQIGALKVVSRTTTMRYGHPDKPLPQIARELSVEGIVEGTVQRSGDRVRITAQLIYGPADEHLWAKSFERDVKDMLEVQNTVASEIAHEIEVKLTPAEQARLRNVRQVNPRALDAYVQARFQIDRASKFEFDKGREAQKDELQKVFSSLDRAIEQDSSYRPAYLAYFEAIDDADLSSPFEYLPKAKAGLFRALELGEEDVEGHLAMAKLLMRYEYDWAGAEKEYNRGIEVDPSSGYAHFSYSEYLANFGRTTEADKELTIAQSLSPAHDYSNDHFAVLQRTGRTLERQRQELEEKTPNNPFVLMIMAKNYGIAGRFKESVEMWERCLTLYGRPDFANVLRQAEAKGGPRFALEECMRAVEGYSRQHDDLPVGMAAFTYSSLGNKDRAFAWLDKAVEQRYWCIPFLKRDNVWNPLRSDPRFKNLLRRVGLPG